MAERYNRIAESSMEQSFNADFSWKATTHNFYRLPHTGLLCTNRFLYHDTMACFAHSSTYCQDRREHSFMRRKLRRYPKESIQGSLLTDFSKYRPPWRGSMIDRLAI